MPDIVGKLKPPRLSAAPSSPVVGELYYNTANNTLYWWNGTAWISASGGASGPFVDFIGTWASGTAYKGGDVVRYNNNDYIAVNPSTGQVPPDPSIPANLAGAPLVTTLPTSPFSGQEVVLVDSLTNPSYNWRFRYNAASTSPYKWEFVGGYPWSTVAGVGAWATMGVASAWGVLSPSISMTIPRAGDYFVNTGSQCSIGGTGYYQIGVCTGSANPAPGTVQIAQSASSGPGYSNYTTSGRVNGAVAGSFIGATYWATDANAMFANRWFNIIPVRVS